MRTHSLVLLVAIATVGPACGHHYDLTIPPGFVELDESEHDEERYTTRATTADGVVIAVREIENDPHGDLDFWAQAIRNRMRMNGGYSLIDERDVSAATGQKGKQLRFGRDQNGTPFVYWVTIFAGEDYLHIVEAGGKKEFFERSEGAVERTVASLTI